MLQPLCVSSCAILDTLWLLQPQGVKTPLKREDAPAWSLAGCYGWWATARHLFLGGEYGCMFRSRRENHDVGCVRFKDLLELTLYELNFV